MVENSLSVVSAVRGGSLGCAAFKLRPPHQGGFAHLVQGEIGAALVGWDPMKKTPLPLWDQLRSVLVAQRAAACCKRQKCVSLAASRCARCSGALSAFAYRPPIENRFACSEGEPAQKSGVCAHRDLVSLGCVFFPFPEEQLEFHCPFPLFSWSAVPGSHAVSSLLSSPAFPSPRGEERGLQRPSPALVPSQEAAETQALCD